MNLRRTQSWFTIITLFLLINTVSMANAEQNSLVWAGCSVTKKAFMSEIAAAYEKRTGTKVSLEGGGATKGIRFAASNKIDVGGSCRHRLFIDGVPVGTELRTNMHQVAWDAIAVIVHPDISVDNISTIDLKKVYNGRITNWKELGGPDAPIVIVTREGKYSGVEQMFRVLMFGDQTYDYLAKTVDASDSGSLEEYLEKTKFTIAVDGISSAKKSKVRVLALDGTKPTKENIMSAKYPLFRPLYLVTNTNPKPEVTGLVNFTLSPDGQRIISEQGTVNLEEGKALVEPWDKMKAKFGG